MSWAAEHSILAAGAPRGFAPYHPWDRNFFLLYVLLIWLGILMGFTPQVVRHITQSQPPYPLIVHFHALAFVGWLVLLTAQVMLILGPATAVVVQRHLFGGPHSDVAFFSVQLTDILAFAGLIVPAVLLRDQPAAHKRLILLATLYIADAGFSRWLGDPLQTRVGDAFWGQMAQLYLGNDLLIVGLGIYDLITRQRLQRAYIAGVAWIVAIQMTAVAVYLTPAWKPVAQRLLGL
jgi:hypothetical protein